MSADQFNLRLRDDRAQAVRIHAARLGVKPRDVIEQLIDDAPWSTINGTTPEPQAERLPLDGLAADSLPAASTRSDPVQRDDDPAPESVGEPADQRAGDARTPRRRGRKDRADKGAEGAKSGQGRGRGTPNPVDPAAPSPGCPECGGQMLAYMGNEHVLVCVDCEFKREQ